ncbi:hypothetical protein vseg_013138 [Gypsophila vaccaria]
MKDNIFENYEGYMKEPTNLIDKNFYESSNPNYIDLSEITPDFPDACLKFINDILMEEDLDDIRPNNLQDFHALLATEKSLYDALGNDNDNDNYNDNCKDIDNGSGGVVESNWLVEERLSSSVRGVESTRVGFRSGYVGDNVNGGCVGGSGDVVESNWFVDGRLSSSVRGVGSTRVGFRSGYVGDYGNGVCVDGSGSGSASGDVVESNWLVDERLSGSVRGVESTRVKFRSGYVGDNGNDECVGGGSGDVAESNWLVEERLSSSVRGMESTRVDFRSGYVIEKDNDNDGCAGGSGDVVGTNWLVGGMESTRVNSRSGYVDGDENDLLREVYRFMGKSSREGKGRKNHERESVGEAEERRSKYISTSNNEEYVEMKDFDDILICEEGKDDISPGTRKVGSGGVEEKEGEAKGGKNRRKARRGKGEGKKKKNEQVVDLRNLLIQCAQEAASSDFVNATEGLRQIREHASAYGDSTQRVAYYFANGLEARMAGTGSDMYRDFAGKPITSAEILKGYKLYVSAVPFQRTTYYLANQTIAKLAAKATKVHIIDFGIFFGFQWPGLIQLLSRRRVGPPKLRITGVDHPMPGFKPAQKVQETGNRLAGYCQRFGVPFEFQAIAQRWHTLKPEDFKIEKDELVIVSCVYQSGKIPDESVDVDSPRDCFLKMIRGLNADLFIHGVVNGTFNAPFFITRFREALYHYSALFDVFEATMPREDPERLLIERFLYGKDAMNIVACEGSERIERPESYKQWQMRHRRVGFTQVTLDQDVVHRARAMVKANYHKDFMVEQDKEWMVQGWKGRILSAVSCWKPA